MAEDSTPTAVPFEIAKLRLERGDVLVVKLPIWPTGPDEQQNIADHFKRITPSGIKILYLPKDIDLSILTKAEIESRANLTGGA